ncbi:MAG: hypothetical protein ABEI57_05350 [Halapricum sp.]
MSDEDERPSVEQQLRTLTETLERLQGELERERRSPLAPRPPTFSELRRFTSEVAIPGLVLLLETNVRALKLLQRTLRMADERGESATAASERASEIGSIALARLDETLADVQSALAGEPTDSEARDLLEEARTLRADIEDRLAEQDGEPIETGPSVDVEAELQSIKDQVDDEDGTDDSGDGTNP